MTAAGMNLAITGWGVVSAIGAGVDEFSAGVLAGHDGAKTTNGQSAGFPVAKACHIPEFDPAKHLGKKGTRFLDRTTTFAVVASGMALESSGIAVTPDNQNRIGVVLGTSTGSIKSITDFTRDTLVQEKPYFVNPLLFPNTVMNCAAGQVAIWHKLKGVNATVSGGHLSSLLALRYAAIKLQLGSADALVTGGTEEFCEQMAWGFYHSVPAVRDGSVLLGEGCVMVILERAEVALRAGRRILARLLACEAGVAAPDKGVAGRTQALSDCVRRALTAADTSPESCWAAAVHRCGDEELEQAENAAVRDVFGSDHRLRSIDTSKLAGECFSASGAFQLASLLALFRDGPEDAARTALLISTGRGGRVGCAVVREERL